jgi:3-oxoacyl-[acyl-carrier-protein] synthase II
VRSRAVVTGLGGVSAYGLELEGLSEALRASSPLLSEVDRSAGYALPGGAGRAVLVGGVDLKRLVSPLESRRMSAPSRWSVAAARLALEDAGFVAGTLPAATGVYFATAFGAVRISEELVGRILREGPEAASPMLFPETVTNAPAAQIAIVCGARGPSVTVTQREAGALIAVGMAARDISRGRIKVAIAGAVDEASPLLHSILDRFRALARPGDNGREEARTFDARRGGFLMGEGATALVLESEESARDRRARMRVCVAAAGAAFDPTAPVSSWGGGHEQLAAGLRAKMAREGIGIEALDRIVSGASGSVAGDRLEARTLRALFGDRLLPPVLVPKAVTGEYGGGFLAAAILAAGGALFGPAPGFRTPDPACGVVPHDGAALAAPELTLVSSLAAGGAAAWIFLRRPSE